MCLHGVCHEVQDDPKLLGDSEEVPISECSDWQSKSLYEIFPPLHGEKTR
jgi:hypothetical protein